jgi:type IV secretion system protein VirB10
MRGTFIVSPHPYQAPGGVPRGLLAGIAGVVAVLALVVVWLTGDDHPPPTTADARARAQLERADTVQAQPRGSARAVDEAAERAVQASRSAAVRAAAGSAPATVLAAGTPWPTVVAPVAPASPEVSPEEAADRGQAAREIEARSAEGRIFDSADTRATPGAAGGWVGPTAAGPGADAIAPLQRGVLAGEVALQSPEAGSRTTNGDIVALPAGSPDAGADLEHVAAALRRLAPAPADAAQRGESWQARTATAPAGAGALAARSPVGAFVIDEGTVIPAVLTRRISTDAPGVVTAMVSMDVYDSRTARALLLPKGARLVGRYNSDVAAGQARLQFAFTRLILPDGSNFDLPGAAGSDAAGQGGLEADVDRHVLQTFGAALLIGVIADRVVRPQSAPSPGTYGGGLSATGQVLVDTANAALQRNVAIAPTLTVEEGARLNVEVVRDLVFPKPYRMPS